MIAKYSWNVTALLESDDDQAGFRESLITLAGGGEAYSESDLDPAKSSGILNGFRFRSLPYIAVRFDENGVSEVG